MEELIGARLIFGSQRPPPTKLGFTVQREVILASLAAGPQLTSILTLLVGRKRRVKRSADGERMRRNEKQTGLMLPRSCDIPYILSTFFFR